MTHCSTIVVDLSFSTLKQYERAISDLDEAIRLKPDDVTAYRVRGYVYHKLGQNERAIADYTEAIHLDPHYADTYHNRGLAYGNLEQHEQARADFDMAESLKL